MKFDTLVLGGGMIGVSVAVHLQQRGLSVALVDRKAPGNETSFGNAGLIQREGVYPYAFPRGFGTLLKYACNRSPDVRYHAAAMPKLAPFLYRYWRNSHPARHAAIARAYAPLIEHCVTEHRALIDAAGAGVLLRDGGWLKVFRRAATRDAETRNAERWRAEYGVTFDALDAEALRDAEPFLSKELIGALRYTGSDSIRDPHALVTAYARHFERLGGRIVTGDALTLAHDPGHGWRVDTAEGPLDAHAAVVALGPWSDLLCERLGYRLPLAVKRGYHMHYAAQPGARLNRPVLDADGGFLIAPMTRGIRLTTGAELGLRDTPATPAQLAAVEPVARWLFPLGARVDGVPWLGRRPCTPDMLPVIGAAPRHRDLWFAFGHAHHGFTLGPVTGRLVADLVMGTPPFVDPAPFRVERFLRGR
ncbi:NAD(P)/FAD-dependent oxidoreductase [Burkholderia stagnalis]|uniref:NAD(P)/FAD-dependent oxidoreductase n=1 Tax=Burkholderia stagnalis TaxID=1503054 RepID=UPI000F56FA35|nr:FAD-dependent oxidoreductase [Burkholderia stagnalis]RQQ22893.1 FAD-binding oxidoreductase [Burkholderia stagnalis]RQQ31241.1 FAD-binding oxidoreductase [Burkholderia stagnalis]RQQ47708.1 FAD-binding oxidoreductase [Burkholderia stagnalis]RQX90849.1 FAD-binding oxidoreductase [Burkholderia stagnalis]RQY14642.1 FAD-binding oxidoreductase [Burkholderia stagnalis]